MGTKYDRGLYDGNDLIAAYNEGYDDALRKLVLEVRVSCPWCATQLAITKHPFLNLPADILSNTRWCAQCETTVGPQIQIAAVF